MKTLQNRIIDLFETEKLYLDPNLQMSDIALKLGVTIEEIEKAFSDDSLIRRVKGKIK